MSEDRSGFDVAIDRAVHDMLDVEPPAGLRGRVLQRIQHPSRKILWTAVPLAAAAILILAVLLPSRDRVEPQHPTPVAAVETPVAPRGVNTTPGPVVTRPIPVRRSEPSTRRPALPEPPSRGVVAAALPTPGAPSGIEPLTPIVPISVAAVRPAAIEQATIAVTPLAPIAELQIAPLSPPAGRN